MIFYFFFFNYTATTEIYTLSLHDALPISRVFLLSVGRRLPVNRVNALSCPRVFVCTDLLRNRQTIDRKSTRLNSSHLGISYAVFCLKKKKKNNAKPHTARYARTSHLTHTQ